MRGPVAAGWRSARHHACEPTRCAELLETESGLAVDLTSALAGIELEGEALMRRLTDLDLSLLPATGKVAGVGGFDPYPALSVAHGPAELGLALLAVTAGFAPFAGARARLGVAGA